MSVVAQARRDPALQPVSDIRRGDLLLGLGVGGELDARFPLAALEGDRLALGRITFAYGVGDRALLEVRGDVRQVLWVERAGEPAVPLEPEVADGRTSDAGDFRVGLLLAPLGHRRGLSAGGRVEMKLPNTDERKGIGANTIDVLLAALGSYGAERWRTTVSLGVGILEAPLESFEQNDVVDYALEWLVRPRPGLRLGIGVQGRASTRDRVPLGTGDLGEVRADADVRIGEWLLDLAVGRGYAGDSAGWTGRLGVSWWRRGAS